jgi:hypothetical protein
MLNILALKNTRAKPLIKEKYLFPNLLKLKLS